MESERNLILLNKINNIIKNAAGAGRDHLSTAESIYILKVTDALVKEYQSVLQDNQ